mgnify:CR=1 FL=1
MANHKLDDKILIRALKQFLYCDSQKQAAHELGLPMTTYRSHIDMGKRKFKISEEEYWAREFAHKLPNDMMFEIDSETIEEKEDMSEYVDHLTNRFEKYRNRKKKTKWHHIKIKSDEPIAIVWMGDPHIDDNGCDWTTLRRDIDIINSHENIKGASLGDMSNNWVGRLARLYGDQDTSESTAWKLVEWFIKETDFLLLIGGNHDLWSGAGDPINYMKSPHTIYDPWESRISLDFPNGKQCKIYTAHDMPGHSMWNPLHAQMKKANFQGDAHLYIAGHRHTWALAQHELYDGKIHWLARARGYKFFDKYARDKGLDEQSHGQAIMQVIDPNAEEHNMVQCFKAVSYTHLTLPTKRIV